MCGELQFHDRRDAIPSPAFKFGSQSRCQERRQPWGPAHKLSDLTLPCNERRSAESVALDSFVCGTKPFISSCPLASPENVNRRATVDFVPMVCLKVTL